MSDEKNLNEENNESVNNEEQTPVETEETTAEQAEETAETPAETEETPVETEVSETAETEETPAVAEENTDAEYDKLTDRQRRYLLDVRALCNCISRFIIESEYQLHHVKLLFEACIGIDLMECKLVQEILTNRTRSLHFKAVV